MTSTVEPPRPPLASKIRYDKQGNICLPKGFGKWRRPLREVRIHTVDQSGGISLARVAAVGVLGLGRQKKATIVVVTDFGESHTVKVKGATAGRTLTWAVQFNAWREAVTRGT